MKLPRQSQKSGGEPQKAETSWVAKQFGSRGKHILATPRFRILARHTPKAILVIVHNGQDRELTASGNSRPTAEVQDIEMATRKRVSGPLKLASNADFTRKKSAPFRSVFLVVATRD